MRLVEKLKEFEGQYLLSAGRQVVNMESLCA